MEPKVTVWLVLNFISGVLTESKLQLTLFATKKTRQRQMQNRGGWDWMDLWVKYSKKVKYRAPLINPQRSSMRAPLQC